METKLLDSAYGSYDGVTWTLVQWWDFDKEFLVRVTVSYNMEGMEGSTASAVLINTEDSGKDTDIIVRQFPSVWWEPVDSESAGLLLDNVATELLTRMSALLDAQEN